MRERRHHGPVLRIKGGAGGRSGLAERCAKGGKQRRDGLLRDYHAGSTTTFVLTGVRS